jgi:hypothetical protein
MTETPCHVDREVGRGRSFTALNSYGEIGESRRRRDGFVVDSDAVIRKDEGKGETKAFGRWVTTEPRVPTALGHFEGWSYKVL